MLLTEVITRQQGDIFGSVGEKKKISPAVENRPVGREKQIDGQIIGYELRLQREFFAKVA